MLDRGTAAFVFTHPRFQRLEQLHDLDGPFFVLTLEGAVFRATSLTDVVEHAARSLVVRAA